IWENREEIAGKHPAGKAINEKNAARRTGTDYHPGAVRFYKEIGLMESEAVGTQEAAPAEQAAPTETTEAAPVDESTPAEAAEAAAPAATPAAEAPAEAKSE
ncbi:MAG: hypothetical protein KDB05_22775, partial [Planctomycetales bacterium]|nr:hypothetical protein [Planctomycetales bacterium]